MTAVDEPRRGIDPVALAVLGVAGLLIVAIGSYVAVSYFRQRPAPIVAPVAVRKPPPVEAKKAPPPAQKQVAPEPAQKQTAPVPAELMAQYGTGRSWRYRVSLEPAVWRDATLTYRLVQKGGNPIVATDFRHAGGQSSFELGTFLAGHPSHAQLRFPGFFMYAAYLDRPLEVGSRFVWQWPWQTPDGRVSGGRIKRYSAEVKAWETLPAPPSARAPMDTFAVARIDATLAYIESGVVKATVSETLWYAPRYLQVVKLVREGRSPDEGAQRIVAELVEYAR